MLGKTSLSTQTTIAVPASGPSVSLLEAPQLLDCVIASVLIICSGTRNLGVSNFLLCDAWVLALSLCFFQVNFSQFQSASVSQQQAWSKLLSSGAWLIHVCLPTQLQLSGRDLPGQNCPLAEGDL